MGETLGDGLLDSAVVIGFVNVVSFFVPNLDSRYKVGLAFIAALFLVFVPIEAQIMQVINLLFGSSGLYKVATKLGAIGAIRGGK